VTLQFQTESEAALELEEAADWYEQRRLGLGDEFLAAIDEAIAFIACWPEAGSPVPDVLEDLSIRRTPVRRFPYQVVYLQMDGVIRILAFAHDRRSPTYWHGRTRQ